MGWPCLLQFKAHPDLPAVSGPVDLLRMALWTVPILLELREEYAFPYGLFKNPEVIEVGPKNTLCLIFGVGIISICCRFCARISGTSA